MLLVSLKSLGKVLVLFSLLAFVTVSAEDVVSDDVDSASQRDSNGEIPPIATFLLIEGVLAANAWLASKNPTVYGYSAAVLFPFGALGEENRKMFWTSLAAAESIAIYNILVDEARYSEKELFIHNMIGWHVFAGVVAVASRVFEPGAQSATSFRMGMQPLPGGIQMGFNYRF